MVRYRALEPLLIVLAVFSILSGCKPSTSENITFDWSRSLRIIPPADTMASMSMNIQGEDKTMEMKWGGDKPGRVAVIVKDHRLQVDGVDYGTVKMDDKVIVDMSQGGKVTVNDQERKPVETKKGENSATPDKS
jgi:hypothetical protein